MSKWNRLELTIYTVNTSWYVIQDHRMTLTSDIIVVLVLISLTSYTNFQTTILLFYLFSLSNLGCKMSQGQHRVIILANLIILKYLMLPTKFQGHWPTCFGEESFRRFSPYKGMVVILVMWPRPFHLRSSDLFLCRLNMKYNFNRPTHF